MATATRDAFADALVRLGSDERIVVLTGDLRDSTRTEKFLEKYPDRFFDVGIAESNMVGIAAGLALSGKIAWACSFSAFITGRYDIVRVSVAYQEANVRIVGTHAGIGVGEDGYSQMSLEDIACMRALPNMAVVNPCDAVSTERAVEALVEHEGPAFLRLTRQKVDDVYGDDFGFELGKAVTVREGTDVALFATGATVQEALKAADALGDLSVRVVDVHTISPIDEDAVRAAARECRAVISVEDHSIHGGLGSAVAEVLASGNGDLAPLRRIGMTTFGESGGSEELYEKFGLSGARIAETTRSFLDQVRG